MTAFGEADRALLAAPLPPTRSVGASLAGERRPISFREAGAPTAPALVLLHGIGSSADGYRGPLAGLAANAHVVAWNAPGYGASAPLAIGEPTPDDYADALAAFLDALGKERVTLVGSSWGSIIASYFAARHPARVAHLVLSAPNQGAGAQPPDERDRVGAALRDGGPERTPDRDAVVQRLVAPGAAPEVVAIVRHLRDAVTPLGWRQAVSAVVSARTIEPLRRFAGPVTVICGSLDLLAPAERHAAPLAAAANATLTIFDGCGHLPKLEAPTRFNQVLATALG